MAAPLALAEPRWCQVHAVGGGRAQSTRWDLHGGLCVAHARARAFLAFLARPPLTPPDPPPPTHPPVPGGAKVRQGTVQGAAAGFVRKFFGIPVTNFISPMVAIAPNSDPKGLYWTTSPTVRGGLCTINEGRPEGGEAAGRLEALRRI